MNKFDRYMKKERNAKCRRLRKIRKARDMASKYTKVKILSSQVYKYVRYTGDDERLFTTDLAKYIYDNHMKILGIQTPNAPKPPRPQIIRG